MKKLLLATALILTASNAFAGGFYISPKLGLSFEDTKKMSFLDFYEGATYYYEEGGSKNDTVFHAGLAAGYDFSSFGINLRAEGEYLYRAKTNVTKEIWSVYDVAMETTVHSFNANVYYDFKNSTAFTPYIGGGIGLSMIRDRFSDSDIEYNSWDETKSKNEFTWNLQAGVDFALNTHNTIGLSYRYTDLGKGKVVTLWEGDPDDIVTYKDEHVAHELTLSYRYTF